MELHLGCFQFQTVEDSMNVLQLVDCGLKLGIFECEPLVQRIVSVSKKLVQVRKHLIYHVQRGLSNHIMNLLEAMIDLFVNSL